ncbi:MAG: hypothetical protein JWQ09_4431 [Segetibacter sp.]|nr:hypothetical protein [Segetibacter sp.]
MHAKFYKYLIEFVIGDTSFMALIGMGLAFDALCSYRNNVRRFMVAVHENYKTGLAVELQGIEHSEYRYRIAM